MLVKYVHSIDSDTSILVVIPPSDYGIAAFHIFNQNSQVYIQKTTNKWG